MQDFIFEANIARYKRLMATETDGQKLATLHKLLVEEQTKLAGYHKMDPRPTAKEQGHINRQPTCGLTSFPTLANASGELAPPVVALV